MVMFKLFTMFSGREWLLLGISAGFIVLGVWMDLTVPEFLREITLLVTVPGYGEGVGEVWVQGLWMMLFAVGSMITALIVSWIAAIVSSGHSARIRKAIFEKTSELSLAEMKGFSVPSLITRSTNDVTQVRMFAAFGMQVLIRAPIMAIWVILKIVDVSWELSLVTIVAVGSLAVVLSFLVVIVLPRFNRIQKLTDHLNQVSRENLTGLRVVRAYNAEDFEQEKFEKSNYKLARNNLVVNRAMGIFWPFMALLLSGLTVAIYWVGSWIISTGRATDPEKFFGDMMVFSQYSIQIIFSFMMLIFVFVMLPRTLVSGRRIMEVLRTQPTIVARGQSDILDGDIECKNVSFQYPDAEKPVIENVNIKIKKGSTVAFIGGTGSGKSTLVNLLPRIYDATQGDITIGGTSTKDVSLDRLNDTVGYIPQTATLFGGSVRYNVTFGKEEVITDDEVWQALEVAQAKDFVSKLESGLDHDVSQGGKNLSGGQKQRLAIARVIARQPKIYIFDDTFSALDYKTDRNLRSALKNHTKDATVLIVAQRIGTIKDADVIYVLDNGRVVAEGAHSELLKTSEIYKEIALSQLSAQELEGK